MTYYVECTHTFDTHYNTGIQRVVRNLVNESLADAGRPMVPVVIRNKIFVAKPGGMLPPPPSRRPPPPKPLPGGVNAARALLKRVGPALKTYLLRVFSTGRHFLAALLPLPWVVKFLTSPRTQFGLSWLILWLLRPLLPRQMVWTDQPILAQPGDVLVLLDASWGFDLWPAVREFQRRGGKVVWVVYDLIPFSFPRFHQTALVEAFRDWLQGGLQSADAILCISRATGEMVRAVLPQIAPERPSPPRISHFWLGSELDGVSNANLAVRPEIERLTTEPVPFYLYVGTVEPRKNHAYALDAFESLWRQGVGARMVIVGRVGWMCEALLERVKLHPALGSTLFMFNDTDDTELARLYRSAYGLLFTSIVEGFGLPIVEALQQGLPVFASDIPVFREIGQEGVTFVDLNDPETLAVAIARHVAAGAPRLPATIRWLTWRQSAEQFWQRLDNCLAPEPDRSLLVG